MKISLISILICTCILALPGISESQDSVFTTTIIPEVDIEPHMPQPKDPFAYIDANVISNCMRSGSFALKARNLTVKELLETICFLNNQNYCLSNGILTIRDQGFKDSIIDNKEEKKIFEITKSMVIPKLRLYPPANIVDAIEFLFIASKDYDKREIPEHEKGLSFAAKAVEGIYLKKLKLDHPQISGGYDGFETLFESIKYVCKRTNTKFIVYGKTIIFLPEDEKR